MLNLVTGCFKLMQLRSVPLFLLEFRENLCFSSKLSIGGIILFHTNFRCKTRFREFMQLWNWNHCIATNGKQFVLDYFHLSDICHVFWLSNCTKHGLWFNWYMTIYNLQGIFDDTSVDCLGTGMQCHGCCVLQRCIAHSWGGQRVKLIAAIACMFLFI